MFMKHSILFLFLYFSPPILKFAAGKSMDDQYLHSLVGGPIGKVGSFTRLTGWDQSPGVALLDLGLDRLIECLIVSRCWRVARQHEMNECSESCVLCAVEGAISMNNFGVPLRIFHNDAHLFVANRTLIRSPLPSLDLSKW
ncbi:hypothetical protein BGZ60DRAFT_413496 [Tricladium varicosporioides]|nr:hypothetical protein BGZ60DRAFT_413496 [Hymenoscyphus varicosporioides]